jgi:integrase/recombinase XerD
MAEELRLFQLHQRQSGMQPPSINGAVSALRFFFTVTLLLQAASAPKYKAPFATAYGAGLRASEVVALTVGDIDSERMLLRVERGKGGKDRRAMLSPQLLGLLCVWCREGRRRNLLLPGGWLFCSPAATQSSRCRPSVLSCRPCRRTGPGLSGISVRREDRQRVGGASPLR